MKRIVITLCIALLGAAGVYAHPHVFADTKLEFEYSGPVCKGFWVEWEFDAMFSASIVQETDANHNGKFEESEIPVVYNYAFKNLAKYGYFTFIRVGSKRYNPTKIERFTASIRGPKMSYRFFVPLPDAAIGKDFYVAPFDTTFYCNLQYVKDPVIVRQTDATATTPKWSRAVNKEYPVYYNPQGSTTDMTTYTAWKPGLEIAWPEEIHVHF